jgi:hypothetical protein
VKKKPQKRPHAEILAELEKVAMGDPDSGSGMLAKVTAARVLLRRRGRELTKAEERLWAEERDPGERVKRTGWHPGPKAFAELDAYQTVAKRRRWWTKLHG